jgi:hypothetical protein
MILLFLMVILIGMAILIPKYLMKEKDIEGSEYRQEKKMRYNKNLKWFKLAVRTSCVSVAAICFLATSCLIIDSDKVGHLKRIYFGKQMPPGRIIAATNEKGPQARILAPGFHLIPLIRVTHDIEQKTILVIDQGKYGFIVARDGNSMSPNKFIADEWSNVSDMINAEKFMGYTEKEGGPLGTKGPQLTVLPPGSYRINRYLFDAYEGKSTPVPAGMVAVIKSNVGDDYKGPPILPSGVKMTDLSVPIVPKGYRGVWKDVYTPGEYYINEKAYEVTSVDTRVQTWKYLGGYTRRWVDLTVGDDGKITQIPHEELFPVPEDAADSAIILRVEGWDIYQDSRVQVQVTPENAPFVVASVGGVKEVEDKIITPNYRSIIRNVIAQTVTVTEPVYDKDGDPVRESVLDKNGKVVVGVEGPIKMHTITRPRKVLDLLYHRALLEKAVAKDLVPAGAQAGLTVQWVRFGDPAVPPALLIPGKRKQLANSLMSTYKQEKLAQTERVHTESEKARADQQAELMKSEIGIKVADNNADARQKEGAGEEKYLKHIAAGQLAQANVLGKDKAFELAYVKELLGAAIANPAIIKMPGTLVMGSDSGLSGAAAILGANNMSMSMQKSKAPVTKK